MNLSGWLTARVGESDMLAVPGVCRAFASPKSRTFTVPSGVILMVQLLLSPITLAQSNSKDRFQETFP